jgi:hypothetical protein
MGFLQRLSQITKPRVFEKQFDFGQGDGEETIYFRALTYNERANIIGKRMDDQNNIKVDPQFFAELVSTSLCKEDGAPVVNVASIQKWSPPDLVDRLGLLAMDVIVESQQEVKPDPPKG